MKIFTSNNEENKFPQDTSISFVSFLCQNIQPCSTCKHKWDFFNIKNWVIIFFFACECGPVSKKV